MIPILVIRDRITTAIVKYDFMRIGAVFQLRYSHDAAVNLASSNDAPMIAIDVAAAGKIATRPDIEKNPATAETIRAENSNSPMNNMCSS
jgi:hypothetical protein